MSRGPYNTNCDLYYGPGVPPPLGGQKYATAVPCRFVKQDDISQNGGPNKRSKYWMTIDVPYPSAEAYTHVSRYEYTVDWSLADQVAIPSGTAPKYVCSRAESIAGSVSPPYDRVLLIPLPFPPAPPPPPPPPAPGCAYNYGVGGAAYPPTLASAGEFVLVAGCVHVLATIPGWSLISTLSLYPSGIMLSAWKSSGIGGGAVAFSHPAAWAVFGVAGGTDAVPIAGIEANNNSVRTSTSQPVGLPAYMVSSLVLTESEYPFDTFSEFIADCGAIPESDAELYIGASSFPAPQCVPVITWCWIDPQSFGANFVNLLYADA